MKTLITTLFLVSFLVTGCADDDSGTTGGGSFGGDGGSGGFGGQAFGGGGSFQGGCDFGMNMCMEVYADVGNVDWCQGGQKVSSCPRPSMAACQINNQGVQQVIYFYAGGGFVTNVQEAQQFCNQTGGSIL